MSVAIRSIPKALALLAALCWAPSHGVAGEHSGFVPSGLLVGEHSSQLPFAPVGIVATDTVVYLIGRDESGPQIVQVNGTTLEVTGSLVLPMDPADLIASFDGDLVYVIGTQRDGRTRIVVLDDALRPVGELITAVPVAHPTLSLAEGNRLLVGGLPTDKAKGALLTIDMSDPSSPKPIRELMPDAYNLFGIAGAWLDDTYDPTLFINTGLLPTLLVVGISPKGATEYADLSFDNGGYDQEPLTLHARMSRHQCLNDTEQATFLLSSNINENLFLAVYDPDFRSLDIVSRTEANLRMASKSEALRYEDSKVLVPTSLLASSCDLGVVWMSDINSAEIEQFAVNPDRMTLEKIGEIAIEVPPTGIVVTDSGRSAFVISGPARTITRYHSGSGEVIGTEDARNLQRLLTERGFPVGAIDGQIGVKTLNAVARFEERNNVKLDIRGDLEGALKTLEAMPAE